MKLRTTIKMLFLTKTIQLIFDDVLDVIKRYPIQAIIVLMSVVFSSIIYLFGGSWSYPYSNVAMEITAYIIMGFKCSVVVFGVFATVKVLYHIFCKICGYLKAKWKEAGYEIHIEAKNE